MGEKHLILFGSDSQDDGAVIVAYNVSLGVGSCRYPMKIYCKDSKLYCFNNRIILEASNHIGMLPYALEISRSLSSLLGSHEVQNECTEFVNWGKGESKLSVSNEIEELIKIGLTERAICSQIIPPLIERDELKKIKKIMKEFKDIPESIIVALLQYIITSMQNEKYASLNNKEEYETYFLKSHIKHKLLFLNYLFGLTFSDSLLIIHLRNNLSLNSAVFILNYISFLLTKDEQRFDTNYEGKLFDWVALLMDAFYQQYVMTKDNKVTYALENMRNVVIELTNQLLEVNSILPVLHKMISKKNLDDEEILPYTIELMQI